MDTLHAQKENVDTTVRGVSLSAKLSFGGPVTPKRGFVIHEDSKSGKKGLKESSTKKRRVLGDISNKQNRQGDGSSNGVSSVKKVGLSLRDGLSNQLSAKKKRKTPLKVKPALKTPLKTKSVLKTPLKTKSVVQNLQVEDVPEIEFAYGGVSSPKAKSAYLAGLRDEMVRDLMNDKTPTLFDDFDPAEIVSAWDDEKAMLESGELPSPWWSSPSLQPEKKLGESDTKEKNQEQKQEEEQEEDDFGDVPPPDELPDDTLDEFDDGGLLENLVSVDVEAACAE